MNPDGTESKRAYHTVTRGLILNEIVRRVDPKGRTIGEICREDLELDDLYCGVREEELGRVTALDAMSMGWVATQSLLPYFLGSQVDISIFDLYRFNKHIQSARQKTGPQKPLYVNVPKVPYLLYKLYEESDIRKGELPSSNFHGNARSLGKLASILSNKGKTTNKNERIISEEAWDKMHDRAIWAQDAMLGIKIGIFVFFRFYLKHNTNSLYT